MIRRIIILISYAASLIIVLCGTIVLAEITQGYVYDFRSGQFGINGYLSLTSTPSSASLFINGKFSRHSTPYRNTLKTGGYNLELRKTGYRTWSKQVDVTSFGVLQFDRIFLVPNTIQRTNLTPGQKPSGLVASNDRMHFSYLATDSTPEVWVVGSDPASRVKVFVASAASADHPAETIQSVSWSADNSHLLVRSDIGGTAVYNLVGATGGSPTNLSDIFKLDLSGLEFSSYDWRQLYWNSGGDLRRLNVNDRTSSVALADKVSGFTFAGDRIIYVHTTALGKSIWSMDRSGNNQKQLIESLVESSSYQLAYANYSGLDALGVLPVGSGVATLYLDIFSTNPVAKVVSKNTNQIKFSDNRQYLGFYNAAGFGTYDLATNTVLLAPKTGPLSCFSWFDRAHVVLCRPGEVDVAELDGANLTKVSDAIAGSMSYGNGDLRHVYTIGPLDVTPAGVVSAQIKP